MSRAGWESEAALAAAFQTYCRSRGWETYPEVEADIIVRADTLMAVEAKLHTNLKVIAQARAHQRYFPEVYALVPFQWRNTELSTFLDCCQALGIGVWQGRRYDNTFELKVPARRSAVQTPNRILDLLTHDATQFGVAGAASPSGFSRYYRDELVVARYVLANPGCTPEQAWMACNPPALHKRTGKPRKPNRVKLDYFKWAVVTGKHKLIGVDASGKAVPTAWFLDFEARTQQGSR